MQKTFFSNLFARRQPQQSDAVQQFEVAPIELDPADLGKVAGGALFGPNGTWGSNLVAGGSDDGPNGTW